MRLTTLLILSLLCLHSTVFSQPICGFDSVHARRMQNDPAYRQRVQESEQNLRLYIQKNKSRLEARAAKGAAALYTIPVVVHVVHTGGPIGSIYNPTDAQIQGAINYLNQVYNGTYPGTQGIGDLQIQFVLAQRDPNCNPTNGINRINGSGIAGYAASGVSTNPGVTPGTNELNVKNLIRWNTTQYYNIWIVNKIDGNDGTSGQFIAGFAYFPGSGASYDGTIMLATQMVSGQKTLPHEIGHSLSVYHPFQGSPDKNTCPTNANCNTDGDMVCDTDPITYNQLGGVVDFTPRTGNTNPCTGTAFTINTENNYMNYTSLYTLFTAGQKARMQAALSTNPDRTGFSTSLGGTPPNAGATQCAPKIDFEFTEDAHTESSGATSGCRSYTDYTYNMVIGNSPSANATATLNIAGGTAVEGLDFDITTNGSFAAPSKVLTFPAGSNTSQPFTVRIYNDAEVESTESFTLGFTVNSGGGNAVAGDGKSNLTITITDNDIAPYGPTGANATIGIASFYLNSPFFGQNAQEKTQFLYKASELTSAGVLPGNITALALYLSKSSTIPFQGLTIKMGHTTQSSLYNTTTSEFPVNDAGFTTVYSNNYSTVNGWNTFNFSTPFNWNGTSNVVVEICYDNGVTTNFTDNCIGYDEGTGVSELIYGNNTNCNSAIGSINFYSGAAYKPMIVFTYTDPGTQVQTNLNASKQEYLGPNSDVYFYDQTNNKLLARVKNLTSFDYGCTQVVIDRAGSGASAFWNNTTANYLMNKTFRIIPTTNNPSGQNQVTLYYSAAEKAGWEAATGQTWSNVQLVKVPSQIGNYSPASPAYDGAGKVLVVTPTAGTLGSQYSLTYTFSNGFSGFGAGIPGNVTLPVTLLSFDGKLESNSTLLSWTTGSEESSKNFDIEKSTDGNNFYKIGSVNATGNSLSVHNYSFRDDQLAPQNYYRLRINDVDGHNKLSQVVLIRYNSVTQSVSVINNPFRNYIDLRLAKPSAQVQLQLINANGAVLFEKQFTSVNQIHWQLPEAVSNGVYVLKIITDGQLFTKKVVKE